MNNGLHSLPVGNLLKGYHELYCVDIPKAFRSVMAVNGVPEEFQESFRWF